MCKLGRRKERSTFFTLSPSSCLLSSLLFSFFSSPFSPQACVPVADDDDAEKEGEETADAVAHTYQRVTLKIQCEGVRPQCENFHLSV